MSSLSKKLNEAFDCLDSCILTESQGGYVIAFGGSDDDRPIFFTSRDSNGKMWGTACFDVEESTEPVVFSSENEAKEALRKDAEASGKDYDESDNSYNIVPYGEWEKKKEEYLDFYGKRRSKSFKNRGSYVISYGRGDYETFKSLKAAKKWQVDNIWPDYIDPDNDPEDIPVKYDWEEVDGALEFCMYLKDGSKVDTDTTDGAGWFIEMDEE